MNAYHLLTVLKDARDLRLWREQAAIVEQLGLDCEHAGHTIGIRPLHGAARGNVTAQKYGRSIVRNLRDGWLNSAGDSRRMRRIDSMVDDSLTALYEERRRIRLGGMSQQGLPAQTLVVKMLWQEP